MSDPTDEGLELLVANGILFLRAGGSVSLTEWLRLSDQMRAALAAAGARVSLERAAALVQVLAASGAVLPTTPTVAPGAASPLERATRETLIEIRHV